MKPKKKQTSADNITESNITIPEAKPDDTVEQVILPRSRPKKTRALQEMDIDDVTLRLQDDEYKNEEATEEVNIRMKPKKKYNIAEESVDSKLQISGPYKNQDIIFLEKDEIEYLINLSDNEDANPASIDISLEPPDDWTEFDADD